MENCDEWSDGNNHLVGYIDLRITVASHISRLLVGRMYSFGVGNGIRKDCLWTKSLNFGVGNEKKEKNIPQVQQRLDPSSRLQYDLHR